VMELYASKYTIDTRHSKKQKI